MLKSVEYNYSIGTILTYDHFYFDKKKYYKEFARAGALAVEMETAALYYNARRFKKNALSICTVTDSVITGENLNSDERRTKLKNMIELALNMAKEL